MEGGGFWVGSVQPQPGRGFHGAFGPISGEFAILAAHGLEISNVVGNLTIFKNHNKWGLSRQLKELTFAA